MSTIQVGALCGDHIFLSTNWSGCPSHRIQRECHSSSSEVTEDKYLASQCVSHEASSIPLCGVILGISQIPQNSASDTTSSIHHLGSYRVPYIITYGDLSSIFIGHRMCFFVNSACLCLHHCYPDPCYTCPSQWRLEKHWAGKKPPVSIWVSICSDVTCSICSDVTYHTSQYRAPIPTYPPRSLHLEFSFSIGPFILPSPASFFVFPILLCCCVCRSLSRYLFT